MPLRMIKTQIIAKQNRRSVLVGLAQLRRGPLRAPARWSEADGPIPGLSLGERKGLAAAASANPLAVHSCGGPL
jgi:hypothetical protein